MGEPSMQAITTVGLDIAKSVFQVHGVYAAGKVIIRRQLKRRHVLPFFERLPACIVGMEACATSHHWSREIRALGHTVRLMPPAYVKPYVRGQKNDAAAAEDTGEAEPGANWRFVETKPPEQGPCLMPHRGPPHRPGHQRRRGLGRYPLVGEAGPVMATYWSKR